ncbi:MAG: response regulator [Bdellovibrionota bacterium]
MEKVRRILVIDDDQDFLAATSAMLESNGYLMIPASSVDEALSRVDEIGPDLIFCDMMMEEMDSGLETAKKLRQQHVKAPIYLMSSIADTTAMNFDVAALGFSGTVQKPINAKMILDIINNS